jgi:N-acetylglucosaminyldiphosphoundecaprenol N-acetyl-beta-D-mannosaminyltransferase
MKDLKKENIGGVMITNAEKSEVLEYLLAKAQVKGEKCAVFTPNPEIFMYALSHEDFKDKLNKVQVALCDGVGLLWASKLLKQPLKERITGVDLLQDLCKESVRKTVSIGFLGGRDGVALKTAECLSQKYPGLRVSFVGEEWPTGDAKGKPARNASASVAGGEQRAKETLSSMPYALPPEVDILFVAFGFPKQEEWICENLPHIPVKIAVGVGGAFDYIAGKVPRAPMLVRKAGFEWLYRLIHQPWRIKRQIALVSFIIFICREKIRLLV